MQTEKTSSSPQVPLGNLSEQSLYAIFIHDGRDIVSVNEAFLGLFNFRLKSDVVGEHAIDKLVHDGDREIVLKAREIVKEGDPFFIPSILMVKGDRSVFLAEAHVNTIVFDKKPYVRVYCREISDTKNAELKLLESGRKYKTLFENSVDGLYKKNSAGRFIDTNPALVKMLGYSSSEELRNADNRLYFGSEEHKIGEEDRQRRYALVKKDGAKIWVEDHCYYDYNEHGDIIFQNGIVRDVTDQLENQMELESLLSVTKDQNQRLKNFARIISHNIRSHTANLTSLVRLLKECKEEKQKALFFDMLTTCTEKLEETIRNLNEVITINQSSNKSLEKRNLVNEVNRVLESLSDDIVQNEIDVSIEIPTELELSVVPEYLDSILLNIIGNSIKYRSKDGVPFISLKTEINQDYCVLSISDNGLGIDLEKHDGKLFGMYETIHHLDDSRGFGLFITKNQVEAMNGKIDVKSKLGVGSTFEVYFSV